MGDEPDPKPDEPQAPEDGLTDQLFAFLREYLTAQQGLYTAGGVALVLVTTGGIMLVALTLGLMWACASSKDVLQGTSTLTLQISVQGFALVALGVLFEVWTRVKQERQLEETRRQFVEPLTESLVRRTRE